MSPPPILDLKPCLSSVPAEEIVRGWIAATETGGARARRIC